jgi:hypothetical protein
MNCWVGDNTGGTFGSDIWAAGYLNYNKDSDLSRPGPSKTWLLLDENQYMWAAARTGCNPGG